MGHAAQIAVAPPSYDAAPNDVLVRVSGFQKRYRKQLAADGLSFEVKKGQIYGLIGPDGAGKSSVMKAIAGVLTFNAGEIEVFGVRLDSEAACERIKSRIGFMPQGLGQNLYADLSVEENIDFFARLRGVSATDLAARKATLLAMTRLGPFTRRRMKELSGGMKQKLGLVCTLIHEPELIILDEPTTGVDPVSRRDFWSILADLLREKGTTAIVSTAYMDEAIRFHRLAFLFGGKIVASGEPSEIRTLVPGSVVSLHCADQAAGLAQLSATFPQVEPLGPALRTFVEGADTITAQQAVQEAMAGLSCQNLCADEPELEDVFLALLRTRRLLGDEIPEPDPQRESQGQHRNGMAIEAIGLTRDFGSFRAVDDVSFTVPQGEIFGLLGANGAGKTTVIKMLTGIIRPTGGTGRVAGADMRVAPQAIKERIGYMSQAFSLYTDLTAIENIRLYAGIYGLSAKETKARTEWVLSMARLHGHETARTASLPIGLRQRLALGCALVHRPQVLFLDEPTSGVDPVGRRQFWDVLFALSREEGVAILVTTHYMSEAEHCDHLALMHAGRIVADAPPEQMKRDVEAEAGHLLEVTTTDPHAARIALRDAGFPDAALFGNRVHLLSRRAEGDVRRVPLLLDTAGIAGAAVRVRPLSLEDVFVYRVTALEGQEGP